MVVTGSLLYLAVQIRENTKLTRAEAQREIYHAYQRKLRRWEMSKSLFVKEARVYPDERLSDSGSLPASLSHWLPFYQPKAV